MPLVTPTRRKGKDVLGAVSRKPGVNPEGVMVCFVETVWENWSFGGGRFVNT